MSRNQFIMLGVAALVITGSTYIHGKRTDRWEKYQPELLNEYTARLQNVPTAFGAWTSTQTDVDEEQFDASNCDGQFSRLFVNSETGEQISVYLVSGRGYHVTIHTPNFCYKAAGFEQDREAAPFEFECPGMDDKSEVVHARFEKETPTETSHLRILWTYNEKGSWRSPKLAKRTFGRADAMYKMYIIRSTKRGVPSIEDDPSVQFAQEFIPLATQALFPSTPPGAAEATRDVDPPASTSG